MATCSYIQSKIWYSNTKFAGRQATTGNCEYLYEVNKKEICKWEVCGRKGAWHQ